jgi:hypothetical protein
MKKKIKVQYFFLLILTGIFAITPCEGVPGEKRGEMKAKEKSERFMIVVQKDLSVKLNADINLSDKKASYKYKFQNQIDQPISLKLGYPKKIKAPFMLRIPGRQAKDLDYTENIKVAVLSKKTRMARVHPFLYAVQAKQKERLMFSEFSLDFTVHLPEGAKLLKSIIPFKKEDSNRLRWAGKGKTVVPPIDIWYTLAEENVSVSKELTEDQNTVMLSINVKNESTQRANNLQLRAQFPKGIYKIIEHESDGTFRLLDNNMYRWYAKIESIGGGETETLELVLKKVYSGGPLVDLEILVYNMDGDLIEIAPAKQ